MPRGTLQQVFEQTLLIICILSCLLLLILTLLLLTLPLCFLTLLLLLLGWQHHPERLIQPLAPFPCSSVCCTRSRRQPRRCSRRCCCRCCLARVHQLADLWPV
jgi:hypothetical protein